MLRSFPRGAPGLALLVLRNALAVMLISIDLESQLLSTHVTAPILAVAVLCLSLGLLLRAVAAFCGAVVAASFLFASHGPGERAAVASAVSFCVSALGPGAYSIDSLWFGRRRRILPPK